MKKASCGPIFLVLGCVALGGCQLGNPSSPQSLPEGSVAGYIISGGPVAGAYVSISGPGGVVGSTRTADNGYFSVDIQTLTSPLTVVATGGSYIGQSASVPVTSGTIEGTFSYSPGQALSVAVTPITTAAASLAHYLGSQGFTASLAASSADTEFGDWLGFDVGTTLPVLLSQMGTGQAFDAPVRYGLVLAALSKWVHSDGGQGMPQLTSLMMADLANDGLLNGEGSQGVLSLGSQALSAGAYRQGLATALMQVAALQPAGMPAGLNGPNAAALTAYAKALATSTSPLFGAAPATSFGSTPLTLSVSPLPAWTHGSLTVTGSVADPFSVPVTVVLTLDGQQYQTLTAQSAFNFTIATSALSDGVHALSLTAQDAAGGKAVFNATLGVDNTPPQACVSTYASLGGSGVVVAGQSTDISGVVGGTVDGTALQIQPNGVWEAQLAQVTPPLLVLTLIDAAGNQKTFSWDVSAQSNSAPCP